MQLLFISEVRIVKDGNNNYYSQESSFNQTLLDRYLMHFEKIIILARTSNSLKEFLPENRIIDKRIIFAEIPYYKGFNQFIIKYFKVKSGINKQLKAHLGSNTVIICRVPGRISSIAVTSLENMKYAYGVEVVGDPFDLFSKGVINHPFRKIIKYFSTKSLKKIVRNASAALYVTSYTLQRRYPCPNPSFIASNVVLPVEFIAASPKELSNNNKTINLVAIGSLDQMYKSPDVVLKSLQILLGKNYNVHLTWIGGGKFLPTIKQMAEELGISKFVNFTGKIPSGPGVFDKLNDSDIYLHISRTEGLPRSLVEAMACGLPCIGTPVGGVPELLDADIMIPTDNVAALADKIIYLIQNPEHYNHQAEKNLFRASQFKEGVLSLEREKFYEYLKKLNDQK